MIILEVDGMFYNITGIVLGIILLFNSIFLYKNKKEKLYILMIGIVLSLGLLGSGIGGFFMPQNLSYVTIILLLSFCVLYLVFYYVILKDRKNTKQTKINS
ncbi:MAG: hypothetical protein K2I77_05235 [Anaeroplasmataceae bacterium]|nr:hypothetical protein [Anaeroplasmataceae bacterium]